MTLACDDLTPDLLLAAYARGIFPMAETRGSADCHLVSPVRRGVIPIDGLRIARSLWKEARQTDYVAAIDKDFAEVIATCAERDETWISAGIERAYTRLHHAGHAHSFEVRTRQGQLVGGLYGVRLGGAFFGESMVSRARSGSRLALCHAVLTLRSLGFRLFDTQFLTPHLASMGGIEVPRATFLRDLTAAISLSIKPLISQEEDLLHSLQRKTQMS